MTRKTLPASEGFGARLRAAREAKGLTLRELADAIDSSASHISKVERGLRGEPVGRGLVALAAEALGVSREWLASGTESAPLPAPAPAGLARLQCDQLAAFAEAAHAVARARALDAAAAAFEEGPLADADPAFDAVPPLDRDALSAVWATARDIRRIRADYEALRAQIAGVLGRVLAPEGASPRALADELRGLRFALARLAGTEDVNTLAALGPAGRAFDALNQIGGDLF